MIEKISGIYRIVCSKNGRYYYGSSGNIHKRWIRHQSDLRRNDHDNIIVQRVYDKWGENSLSCELVESVSVDKLLEVEQIYLDGHVGKSNCMNIAKDVRSNTRGIPRSAEIRKKISDAHKGKIISEEAKRKMSEAHKGVKLSKEHRQRMSDSHKGHVHSEETRRKISKAMKGKPRKKASLETRRKMRESSPRYWKGKTRSPETCRKISIANKRYHKNMLAAEGKL